MRRKEIEELLADKVDSLLHETTWGNHEERLRKLEFPDKPGYCLKHGVETLYNKKIGWHCSVCMLENLDNSMAKAAGEYLRDKYQKGLFPDKPKCGECGGEVGNCCWHFGLPKNKPDPALPLHVEVAKALELNVVVGHKHYPDNEWYKILQFHSQAVKKVKKEWFFYEIPPYDTNRDLAIDAANTYFNEYNLKWGICHLRPPDNYYQAFYFVDFEKDRSNFICGDTAAEALCQLIVKHNKGVK